MIAVAHTMLTAIYHILKEKVSYHDLGADYYSVINQEKLIRRTLHALEKSGMDVIIQQVNKPAKKRAYSECLFIVSR